MAYRVVNACKSTAGTFWRPLFYLSNLLGSKKKKEQMNIFTFSGRETKEDLLSHSLKICIYKKMEKLMHTHCLHMRNQEEVLQCLTDMPCFKPLHCLFCLTKYYRTLTTSCQGGTALYQNQS